MKTYLDCILCFFKQVPDTSKLGGADKTTQKEIIDELSKLIPDFPVISATPEMARIYLRQSTLLSSFILVVN